MRTTISLDDRIFEAVKQRATAEGMSVSAWVAGVLDEAVKRSTAPREDLPFRLVTAGRGGTYPDVDLDHPRGLSVADDEERYG